MATKGSSCRQADKASDGGDASVAFLGERTGTTGASRLPTTEVSQLRAYLFDIGMAELTRQPGHAKAGIVEDAQREAPGGSGRVDVARGVVNITQADERAGLVEAVA